MAKKKAKPKATRAPGGGRKSTYGEPTVPFSSRLPESVVEIMRFAGDGNATAGLIAIVKQSVQYRRINSGVNYLCPGECEKTMSIDARIVGVTVIAPDKCETCQGSGKDPETSWDNCPACHGATKEKPAVRLKLEPRERGGVAGQSVLTILNSPTNDVLALSALIGTEIWGNSSDILVGNRKWAKRIGYTQIELV